MPEVKDKVDASVSAVMPSLMVERVVENNTFVLFQLLYIVTYSHPCSFNTHQRQVDPKLLTCRSVMWSDVTAWSQSTEESMEIVSWYNLLQNFNGFWAFFTILLKLYIMQVKVKDIPVS